MAPESPSMPLDSSPLLRLAHGLTFAELYTTDGARRLDRLFIAALEAADASLAARLAGARADPATLDKKGEAEKNK